MNHNPPISRRSLLGIAGSLVTASALGPGLISQASALSRPEPMIIPPGLREANVSLIATSLKNIGIDPIKQSMSTDIKPLVPIGRTMIGPAVTTKWETGHGPWGKEDVDKYYYDVLDNAAAGSVLGYCQWYGAHLQPVRRCDLFCTQTRWYGWCSLRQWLPRYCRH